jgi:hypothetical protein
MRNLRRKTHFVYLACFLFEPGLSYYVFSWQKVEKEALLDLASAFFNL